MGDLGDLTVILKEGKSELRLVGHFLGTEGCAAVTNAHFQLVVGYGIDADFDEEHE